MENEFKVLNIESKDYARIYSNDTYVTVSNNELVIDFMDEHVDGIASLDRNESDNTMYLKRILKCSLILPRKEARGLAENILHYLDEREEKEEEKEEEKD